MALALVPPATLYTSTAMSPGAVRVCAESIIKSKRSRRPSGFDTGHNPDSGILGPIRWYLPRLDGVLAQNKYSMSIERDEWGWRPDLLQAFYRLVSPLLEVRGRLGIGLDLDLEPRPLVSPHLFDHVSDLNVSLRYGRSSRVGAVYLEISTRNPLQRRGRKEMCRVLAEFGLASQTGLPADAPEFFEGRPIGRQAPVPYGHGLTYQLDINRSAEGESQPVKLRFGGFESLDEAWRVYLRMLGGVETFNRQSKLFFDGTRDDYNALRDQLNNLALGWGLSYLGRLDPEIEPYADPKDLPPDAPRWIPVFQWERGEWKHVVMSVLRFPDGLRLEFASNYANIDWLRKEVAKAAPNMEVEQVLAPGSPGSQYDF